MPGWNPALNLVDLMHCMYHKGTISAVTASTLVEMCRAGAFPGQDLDRQLLEAHRQYLLWKGSQTIYPSAQRHRTKPFTAKKFGVQHLHSFPVINTEFKCFDVKLIMYWCAHIHPASGPAGTDQDLYLNARGTMLRSFCDFYSVCHNADVLLTKAEQVQAHAAGRRAMHCLQYVATVNVQRQKALFCLKPKAHFIDVCTRYVGKNRWNPHMWECWHEETLMGCLRDTFAASHHGSTAVFRSLQRHRLRVLAAWDQALTGV